MAIIKCRECNKAISSMAASCPGCGAPAFSRNKRNKTIGVEPQKNRTTAIILALFLGGIGAHRFYLNQPGWGVIYVIFCVTLIPSIVSIIELIQFLMMSDEEFNDKFC